MGEHFRSHADARVTHRQDGLLAGGVFVQVNGHYSARVGKLPRIVHEIADYLREPGAVAEDREGALRHTEPELYTVTLQRGAIVLRGFSHDGGEIADVPLQPDLTAGNARH